MRVLGLDPGTERTGWGCVRTAGRGPERVASGVLRLGTGPHAERLVRLHGELERVFHSRNARSALLLGQARGVCLLVAGAHGVPVAEYAPASVKRSITGHGAAEKSRVGSMVAQLLGFEPHDSWDETDALALALCHLEAVRPLRVLGAGGLK
jgi:crossover junction endodeoxyribonuclease RuvC